MNSKEIFECAENIYNHAVHILGSDSIKYNKICSNPDKFAIVLNNMATIIVSKNGCEYFNIFTQSFSINNTETDVINYINNIYVPVDSLVKQQ